MWGRYEDQEVCDWDRRLVGACLQCWRPLAVYSTVRWKEHNKCSFCFFFDDFDSPQQIPTFKGKQPHDTSSCSRYRSLLYTGTQPLANIRLLMFSSFRVGLDILCVYYSYERAIKLFQPPIDHICYARACTSPLDTQRIPLILTRVLAL